MSDTLAARFSTGQLQRIVEEAMIYMCACPAQVAKEVSGLRDLYFYQADCVGRSSPALVPVHERIAEATRLAHAEMEACLADVLALEGWDMTTLTMPEGLRQLRQRVIEQDIE